MTTITSLSATSQTHTTASTASLSTILSTPDITQAIEKDSEKITEKELAPEALDAAVSTLNQAFHQVGVGFKVDEESGRVITRIIDSESGEQIRQIPTEEVMRILHYVESQQKEPQSGLLIDDVA